MDREIERAINKKKVDIVRERKRKRNREKEHERKNDR